MKPDDPPSNFDWLPPEISKNAEWMPAIGERPEGMFLKLGGNVGRVTATLRFFGVDLDPDEITRILGCEPSESHRKGDPVTKDGRGQRGESSWRLSSRLEDKYGIDAHIGDIFNRLTDDPAVWRKLNKFNPNIFLGLFLSGFNQGDALSPVSCANLAIRGISLDFDIYSASPED